MSGVAGVEAAGDAREFRFLKADQQLTSQRNSPTPAAKYCRRGPRFNGPAHVYHLVGMGLVEQLRRKVAGVNLQGGHKLSVIGSPFRNVCRTWKPVEFAAPRWGRRPQVAAQRSTHRSSPPHISILPVRSHLRHTLPQAPAGEGRWAERYDGKRDLYFKHAA